MIRTGILQQLSWAPWRLTASEACWPVTFSHGWHDSYSYKTYKQSSEPVTHLWSGLPLVLLFGLWRTDLLLVWPAEQAGQHSASPIVQHLQHTNNLSTMCLDKQTKLTSIAHLFLFTLSVVFFSFEISSSKVIYIIILMT